MNLIPRWNPCESLKVTSYFAGLPHNALILRFQVFNRQMWSPYSLLFLSPLLDFSYFLWSFFVFFFALTICIPLAQIVTLPYRKGQSYHQLSLNLFLLFRFPFPLPQRIRRLVYIDRSRDEVENSFGTIKKRPTMMKKIKWPWFSVGWGKEKHK